MAQASHQSEARPVFRVLAGILFAFGAAAVLISVALMVGSREWWPLSVIVGSLPLTYWCWRIARRGHM
jgi:hypothetical protein